LTIVLNVPFLRGLCHFGSLHDIDVLLCIASDAVSVAWFELLKLLGIKLI
jgi:hypothetical protein